MSAEAVKRRQTGETRRINIPQCLFTPKGTDGRRVFKDKSPVGQPGNKDLPLCCVPEAGRDDSGQCGGTASLYPSRLIPPGTENTSAGQTCSSLTPGIQAPSSGDLTPVCASSIAPPPRRPTIMLMQLVLRPRHQTFTQTAQRLPVGLRIKFQIPLLVCKALSDLALTSLFHFS